MLGAAASDDVALAKTLARAQLTMKDNFGRTPLMLAAWCQSYDMLDWLGGQLQGDTWQLEAQYSKQPCWYNEPFDSASVFHFLPYLDPSHPATLRILERLETAGTTPDHLNRFIEGRGEQTESTPLTVAVCNENRLLTAWLLKIGADPNCHEFSGDYERYPVDSSWPIMLAATHDDPAILALLLKHGASVHVKRQPTWDGRKREVFQRTQEMTPLHVAAYRRRFENVRLLVLHGADFETRCNLKENYDSSDDFRVPREVVEAGMRAEHDRKTKCQPFDVGAVDGALTDYDAAVRAAVEERQLLILGCLSANALPSLPGHLLKRIFDLAKCSYPVVT